MRPRAQVTMHGTYWTAAEHRLLRELAATSLTTRAIARRIGRPVAGVGRMVYRCQLRPRRRRLGPEEERRIADLYRRGYSSAEIGRRVGISDDTARRVAARLGAQRGPGWQKQYAYRYRRHCRAVARQYEVKNLRALALEKVRCQAAAEGLYGVETDGELRIMRVLREHGGEFLSNAEIRSGTGRRDYRHTQRLLCQLARRGLVVVQVVAGSRKHRYAWRPAVDEECARGRGKDGSRCVERGLGLRCSPRRRWA